MGRRKLPPGVPLRVNKRPALYQAWAEDELNKLVQGTPGWVAELVHYKARAGHWEMKVIAPSGELRIRDLEIASSEREVRYTVRSLHEDLVK